MRRGFTFNRACFRAGTCVWVGTYGGTAANPGTMRGLPLLYYRTVGTRTSKYIYLYMKYCSKAINRNSGNKQRLVDVKLVPSPLRHGPVPAHSWRSNNDILAEGFADSEIKRGTHENAVGAWVWGHVPAAHMSQNRLLACRLHMYNSSVQPHVLNYSPGQAESMGAHCKAHTSVCTSYYSCTYMSYLQLLYLYCCSRHKSTTAVTAVQLLSKTAVQQNST